MEGYEGVKELVGFIVWKDTERVKGFKVRFLDIEYILCMCAMRTHTHTQATRHSHVHTWDRRQKQEDQTQHLFIHQIPECSDIIRNPPSGKQ